MADPIPPLPEGFQLDAQQIPALPEGFVLDRPEPPTQTRTERVMSGLGFTSGPRFKGPVEEAIGLGETALQLGTGALATIPAGIGGLVAAAVPGGRTGPSAVENIQQKFTFQPRTEVGQRTSEAVAGLVAPIAEAADVVAETAVTRPQRTERRFIRGEPIEVNLPEREFVPLPSASAAMLAVPAAASALVRPALAARGTRPPARPPTPKPEPAPTVARLKTQASQAYKAAEDAGVIVSQGSFKTFVDGLKGKLAEEGIDATLHPRAIAALKRLEDVGENISIKGTEILRRVINNASKSLDPSERRIAGIMRDQLDDYVQGLGANDIVGGIDSTVATTALRNARDLWSRSRKGEIIEELIENAKLRASQFSGSGLENALRTEFRTLSRNKTRMRGFSAEEQAAIRKVATGGPVGNALRFLGKFAPRGIVSTTLSGGAGFALGGPAGSAAMLGAGEAGRMGATALTRRNALAASELVRRGRLEGPPSTQNALIGPRR